MSKPTNVPKNKEFRGHWSADNGELFEVFTPLNEIIHYWCYIRPAGTTKRLEACYDPDERMLRKTIAV